MADAVTLDITGIPELMRTLEEFAPTIQRRALRSALNFASTPILQDAKRRVPVRTGALRKSLGRRSKSYRRSGGALVIIGPRTGERFIKFRDVRRGGKVIQEKINPNNYAHLVEFGTVRSRAQPFLRTAFDANVNTVRIRFRLKLMERMEIEAQKLAKKNKTP